jgi:hypothetical protein
MKAAYTVGLPAIVACVLAGCATASIGQVEEIEPGRYPIDVPRSYATVVASPDEEMIDAAVRKAGDYCHAKGLAVSVRPSGGDRVVFQCIPADKS